MAKLKKGNLGKFKALIFWALSVLAIVGLLMVLNGPVKYVGNNSTYIMDYDTIVKGSNGLDIGGIISIGKINGTSMPAIALVVGFVGVLATMVCSILIDAKKLNILVVICGLVIAAAGVLVFMSASSFLGANPNLDAKNYVLSKWSVLGGIFSLVSGLGFGALEILF